MTNMVLSTDDRDRVLRADARRARIGPRDVGPRSAAAAVVHVEPTTGVLTQVEGVAPPVTQPTTFTLTCDNQVATAQTTFTIQVKVPATVEV